MKSKSVSLENASEAWEDWKIVIYFLVVWVEKLRGGHLIPNESAIIIGKA